MLYPVASLRRQDYLDLNPEAQMLDFLSGIIISLIYLDECAMALASDCQKHTEGSNVNTLTCT